MSARSFAAVLLAGCAGVPIPDGADLVLSWDGPGRVAARNRSATIPDLPEKEFFERFAVMPLDERGLAVVSLGAAASGLAPEARGALLADLEMTVRAAGFRRIRFVEGGRSLRSWERTESTPWMEDFEAVTRRAFEQDRQADLIAWAHHPNIVDSYARDEADHSCSIDEFLTRVGSFTDRRGVAVVVMGKAYEGDDEDRLYDALRRAGFRKVAIQQAHSRGRPILRE